MGASTLRFTGQVKIPDLDYPGVPAALVVEGKQLELLVEGESLGSWSLVDVRAERLISSAFSLKLADEEVTFIADQPTEFAYGGIEEMATVWAKHQSMRFPRRAVAKSRSRQGTKPSRIGDLRAAIEESLNGAPTALVYGREPARRTAGVESLRKSQTPEPMVEQVDQGVERPATVPYRPAVAEPVPEAKQAAAKHPTPPDVPESAEVPLAADAVPDAPDTPDVVLAEPAPEPASVPPPTDSVFKESVPWAKREEAEVDDEPDRESPTEVISEATMEVAPEVRVEAAPEATEEAAPEAAVEAAPEAAVEAAPEAAEEAAPEAEVEAAPEATVEAAPEATVEAAFEATHPDSTLDAPSPETTSPPATPSVPPASVPWLDPTSLSETSPALDEPEDDDPEAGTADPVSGEGAEAPRHVVDLGAFEDPDGAEPAHPTPEAEPEERVLADEVPQPELATASARGGIMGAVRSAFVRTRVEHTHEFVEAPGGLGIKRQICSECGHISIGLSE
jgi:hypothetical protein